MKVLKLLLPLLLVSTSIAHAADKVTASSCEPIRLTSNLKSSSGSYSLSGQKIVGAKVEFQMNDFTLQLFNSTNQMVQFLSKLAVEKGLARSESEVTVGDLRKLISKPIDFGLLKNLRMVKIGTDMPYFALKMNTQKNCGIILDTSFYDTRSETNLKNQDLVKETFFNSEDKMARPSVKLEIKVKIIEPTFQYGYIEADKDLLISNDDLLISFEAAKIVISNARD